MAECSLTRYSLRDLGTDYDCLLVISSDPVHIHTSQGTGYTNAFWEYEGDMAPVFLVHHIWSIESHAVDISRSVLYLVLSAESRVWIVLASLLSGETRIVDLGPGQQVADLRVDGSCVSEGEVADFSLAVDGHQSRFCLQPISL